MTNYKAIPKELKELNQWVCVKGDSKIPYNADTLEPASVANSLTWTSFYDAASRTDEIGFVFNDNGIIGIDIDDGWNADGFLSNTALDIISKCQSYTEKSRSGRGFHILLKGDLPFKGRNNHAGVEIYKTARYFIMTGNTILYERIEENQEAIDYIVSQYFQTATQQKTSSRIYNPVWDRITGTRIPLRPAYPEISPGSRNICLTSLAGMLHTIGYAPKEILSEIQYANKQACKPPLPVGEVRAIVNSVIRYKRE